jgi:hypothetical protein
MGDRWFDDRWFDYAGATLRACLDCDPRSSPRIGQADFARFLTDDVRLHALHGRLAAEEWGAAETHEPVRVLATHLVITEHGLVFAAAVEHPHPLYYLAVPRTLLDSVADHIADSPPPAGAVAAVDCRMDHDLASIWQFEKALRARLDTDPVLRVQLTPAFAA